MNLILIVIIIPLILIIRKFYLIKDEINYYLSGKNSVKRVIYLLRKVQEPIFKNLILKTGYKTAPDSIILIADKNLKKLELWFKYEEKCYHVKNYNIQAASGLQGPKLKSGDLQVPEGIYKLVYLNPNSKFHLSMKIDYPNTLDLINCKNKGITDPGGDIFIHGKNTSKGCIAVGDKAIEELFYMVEKIGIQNVKVIIMPYDLRINKLPDNEDTFLNFIYTNIKNEIVNIN